MGKYVGQSVPRKEGVDKVTGRSLYVDDIVLDGMIHGITVRSSVPRGKILGVRFDPGVPWDEFVIVTAKDIPGRNVVAMLIEDQPFLADDVIRHPDEPVLLLAHPDKHVLAEAREHVHIDVEPLPAVFAIEDALRADTVLFGDDNVFKRFDVSKGDVDAAFARDDVVIVEGTYETGAQEQMYIEPMGMIAVAAPGQGVTVWGSLQCPYYVHKALKPLFDLPAEQVRVVQTVTGGGFGGKEEYPSIIAGHAALLSWKAGGVPVKLIYDRAEDLAATTKRHPSRTRHRTAVTRDGELVAMDVDFALDGGAYATLSAVVLSRGTIHACGPYRCPNARVVARAVATNHPPHGAFRGFGAPQSIFGLERHMDKIARTLGIAPEELRRRNLLATGDTTATSQVIEEAIDLGAMLDDALSQAGWAEKKAAFAAHNADPANTVKKGMGLATFFHGSGFTGSGEVYLASVVGIEAGPGGRCTVLAASTEIGQGTNTIFSQIAADALRLPYELVEVAQPDTARVPDSGPTVASRTTMVVGRLVQDAAESLIHTLRDAGLLGADYSAEQFAAAVDAYRERFGTLRVYSKYKQPPGIVWDDKHYRGAAYAAYGWAAYIAEVEVDTLTYAARVTDFVAVQDIGTLINPLLAAGQVEGGVAQAIGWAVYEGVDWRDGHMANNQMTNYIIPTAADVPPIRVYFHSVPFKYGPSGAKGVGELPMDGPAPAILNAIEDAIGVSLNRAPALPEDIMEAMLAASSQSEAHHG
ncbi:MAG: carbon monoxide dehydrogenase [Deltaproteobacteria bacterium]|nr:MAG: carbon monoxide dehydrogenase [Deltaproteobacteria bacterium]